MKKRSAEAQRRRCTRRCANGGLRVHSARSRRQAFVLHVVLQQIADFRTREQELKGKVKAAMVYPCVLAVFGVGVLAFLLTFFIPKFSGIFAEFGAQLPWLTQMIVAASNVAVKYSWVV